MDNSDVPPRPDAEPPINPYSSPASDADVAKSTGPGTALLWAALAGAIVGAAFIAPGVAIALAVLSFPAALRTVANIERRAERTGKPSSIADKVSLFFSSLGLMIVTAVSASLAFMAICIPTGALAASGGENYIFIGIGLAIVLGLAVAGFVIYKLVRATWWRKD